MRVYLVRHAKAEPRDAARWPDDAARPLSERGRERFGSMAATLRGARDAVDLVCASPHRRAWETAELLREHARWPEPVACSPLAGVSLSAVGAAIEAATLEGHERVALVGHEPQMSELASWLLVGEGRQRFHWRTGAIACLEVERWEPGAAVLEWFMPPGRATRR